MRCSKKNQLSNAATLKNVVQVTGRKDAQGLKYGERSCGRKYRKRMHKKRVSKLPHLCVQIETEKRSVNCDKNKINGIAIRKNYRYSQNS